MRILLWLLAGLSLGLSEKVSHQQLERSLNRTIDTVEKIIQSNPSLPRLNRHDIMKILLNLTSGSAEMEGFTQPTALPLIASSRKKNDKEQSTDSPLVQMIPDSTEADALIEIGRTEEIIFPPNPKDPSPFVEKSEKYIAEQSAPSITNSTIKVECKTVTTNMQNNDKNIYSEPNGKSTSSNSSVAIRPSYEPENFTFNLANLDQITKSAQEYISSSKSTVDNHSSNMKTSNPEKVAVIYSTSLHPKTNMNNEDKNTAPSNYPQLYDPNSNVQWRYSGPIMMNPKSPGMESGMHFLPTMPNFPSPSGSMKPYFELPKKVFGNQPSMDDMNRPSPVYVTPLSASNEQTKIPEKSTKSNVPNSGGFSIATKIETSVKPIDILQSMGLKMEEKENSHAESTKVDKNTVELTVPEMESSKFNLPLVLDDYNQDKKSEHTMDLQVSEMPEELKNMFTNKDVNIKNLNLNEPSGLSSSDFDSSSINKQNTFSNPISSFKTGVENLTPDVQNLFHRFGLPTSVLRDMIEDKSRMTTTRRPPTTTTASFSDYFTSFKRLPSSKVENKEMRDFLAQFGLGHSESRKQKAMKSSELYTQQASKLSSFDIRKALDNIGLLALVPRSDEVTSRPKQKQKPSKTYVFKPHESLSNSAEQREKIHKLLDTVKMVQEGKVEDVQKVVEDLVQTTRSLKSGPDPVDLDEILQIYKEEMNKGDKKFQRQAIFEDSSDEPSSLTTSSESATTSAEMTSTETTLSETIPTETVKTTSSMSTTEEPTTKKGSIFDMLNLNITANPTPSDSDAKAANQPDNFAALEESFGGTTAAPDPVLPTRPRTGLYFLVDWNTFLEVGEDGKDKVNLRFQPQVGDRTRFIPVKIP